MVLNGLIETIDDAVIRMQFGAGARIELYESLSLLLENHVLLNVALKEMYKIASEWGKKPKNPRAIVIYDCMMGVSEGRPLSKVLAKWTNYQETSLIAAGEKSGNLKKAFDDAIKVITAKQKIMGAILAATIYPVMLFSLSCVLLNMVANELVPKLAKMTDPQTWEGAAALLYQMALFVTGYGKLTLLAIIILVIIVCTTFPYFRGTVRVFFDRIPPWSVYRTLHGSTFLLNVAVMLQAGIKLQDVLLLLSGNANPWLKERIDAALYGTGIGGNLGVALHRAGYDFPDKKAVQYLMILANHDGFEEAISGFGDRWLQESIKKIQFVSKTVLTFGLLMIGALMLIVIAGVGGIQDAIQVGIR